MRRTMLVLSTAVTLLTVGSIPAFGQTRAQLLYRQQLLNRQRQALLQHRIDQEQLAIRTREAVLRWLTLAGQPVAGNQPLQDGRQPQVIQTPLGPVWVQPIQPPEPDAGNPRMQAGRRTPSTVTRRGGLAAERRMTAIRERREHAMANPDMLLEGVGGRANADLLNDFLVVLRTKSDHELRLALGREAAARPIDSRHVRALRLEPIGGGPAFRIDDPGILSPRWPRALGDPRLTDARRHYDSVIARVRAGFERGREFGYQDERDLCQAVERLQRELRLANPRSQWRSSMAVYHDLKVAERFLVGLQQRVESLEFDDPAVSGERTPFDGRTVGELVEHVIDNDLRFATPERSGEATYQHVYLAMRGMLSPPVEARPIRNPEPLPLDAPEPELGRFVEPAVATARTGR